MLLDQVAPGPIPEICELLGGSHEVSKEDGRQHPIELVFLLTDRCSERSQLAKHEIRVANERSMLFTQEHHDLRARNALTDVVSLTDALSCVLRSVHDQRRN